MNPILTKYAGVDWLRESLLHIKTFSPLGENVANLLGVVCAGIYHVDTKLLREVDWGNPRFIEMRWSADLATYDYNLLTRFVVLAHDMAIRLSIEPRSQKYLTLMFHPREREGAIWERHPTIEEAVKEIRKLYT